MAMAVLLPISFFMDPMVGIPFLIGVYKGGIYGGSVPAILVSMPGTGASVATTFDGPSLTKKGKARKAMEMALFASVSGDLASDVLTHFIYRSHCHHGHENRPAGTGGDYSPQPHHHFRHHVGSVYQGAGHVLHRTLFLHDRSGPSGGHVPFHLRLFRNQIRYSPAPHAHRPLCPP